MGWPSFKRTLGFGGMLAVAVGHVITRALELATHHLLYERDNR